MSTLRSDNIVGRDQQNAPNFPKGAIVTGVATATTFDGNVSGNVTGNTSGSSGSCTGNAATATALQNARTIGGVSFDGTGNINLPGVNQAGNQNTTGTAGGLTGTPDITVGSINSTGIVTAVTGSFSGNVSIGGTLTYEDVTSIDSVGVVTAREGVFIPDNKKLEIGNAAGSGDLSIYHNGSHSYIDNSTGSLYLRDGSAVNYAKFASGGSGYARFYQNGNARFETTSTGAIVTGVCTATSFEDDKGKLRSLPQLHKTAAYTLLATDAGKLITITTGGVTVPANVMSLGDMVSIINHSGSDQTITQGGSFTLYNTGDAATGNRTLAGRGMCTIWFLSATVGYISGSGLS